MLISTKGRYALRTMIDLAEHADGTLVPLRDIAERQNISEKYLESIVVLLSRAGFVQASRGKCGGYRLAREAQQYTVGSILRLTDGTLAPVSCLEATQNACPRAQGCKTLPLWQGLYAVLNRYFDAVTLQDLVNGTLPAQLQHLLDAPVQEEREGYGTFF